MAVKAVAVVLATTAVFPLIVDVATPSGSPDVKEIVIMFPTLARVVLALFEAMVIGVAIGVVLSNTTFAPEVMAEASVL